MKDSNMFGKENIPELQDILDDFLYAISISKLNTFTVKGCMALNTHFTNSKLDNARNTKDIDLHYYNKEDWELFVDQSEQVASDNSKLGIRYKIIKRRGFDKNPNSDSLTFEAIFPNSESYTFKIDMNFGGSIETISFDGSRLQFYSIPVILADKLTVLSTRKVCRRVKDILDIYLISSNFDLDYVDICCRIKRRLNDANRTIDYDNIFIFEPSSIFEILHALDKYSESVKITSDFTELIADVIDFVTPIYSYLENNKFWNLNKWNFKDKRWE